MNDIILPDAASPEQSRPQDTFTPTQGVPDEAASNPMSIEDAVATEESRPQDTSTPTQDVPDEVVSTPLSIEDAAAAEESRPQDISNPTEDVPDEAAITPMSIEDAAAAEESRTENASTPIQEVPDEAASTLQGIEDAASPEESRPLDAPVPTRDDPDEVASIPWSVDERLFIELQAGFALTAAFLRICTVLPPTGQSYYYVFRRFFRTADQDASETTPEQDATASPRTQEEYLLKQQELVHWALRKTDELARKAMKTGEFMRGKMWIIEQEVFDGYRKIRQDYGLELPIEDPRQTKKIREFLYRIVCARFPKSLGHSPTSSDADENHAATANSDDDMYEGSTLSSPPEEEFENTESASPAEEDAPVTEETTRRTKTRAFPGKPIALPDDNNAPPPVRQSGRKVLVTDKAKKAQTGTKRTRRNTVVEEESEEENEDGKEDIAEEEEEDDGGASPKKRAKKAIRKTAQKTAKPKTKKGHGPNRKLNDAWSQAEREVIIALFNKIIAEKGLIYWAENISALFYEATDAVNAHRALDKITYPGDPRGMDGVRTQVHKKAAYKRIKDRADALRTRKADPKKTVTEAELKPRDVFKATDLDPGKGEK